MSPVGSSELVFVVPNVSDRTAIILTLTNDNDDDLNLLALPLPLSD